MSTPKNCSVADERGDQRSRREHRRHELVVASAVAAGAAPRARAARTRELRRRDEVRQRHASGAEDPEQQRRRRDPERKGRPEPGEADAQAGDERRYPESEDDGVRQLEPEIVEPSDKRTPGWYWTCRKRIGMATPSTSAPGATSSRTRAARREPFPRPPPAPSLVCAPPSDSRLPPARDHAATRRLGSITGRGTALPRMAGPMRSRLFLRRSTAAAGIYSSAVLGFLATVVAAHRFSTRPSASTRS